VPEDGFQVSVAILLVSMSYFAYDVFIWLGSWGALGRFGTTVWSWLVYVITGAIQHVPMLSRLFAWAGRWWHTSVRSKFPSMARRHRKVVRDSLERAVRTRTRTIEWRHDVQRRWDERRLKRRTEELVE